MEKIVALGIDPGYASTGIACLELEPGENPKLVFSKTIRTSLKMGSRIDRINSISKTIEDDVIILCPDVIGIEDFVHFKGRIIREEAWCVPRVIGALYRLQSYAPIREFNPSRWIALIVGRGMKDGEEFEPIIRKYCALHLGWKKREEHKKTMHEIDAICLALVAGNESRINKRQGGQK